MFIKFFDDLRRGGIPVSIHEYLSLLSCVDAGLVEYQVDRFHVLARMTLVKRPEHFDRFDRIFASHFGDLPSLNAATRDKIPSEWLMDLARRFLDPDDFEHLQSIDSLEELLKEFEQRLKDQEKRHEGGSKWIGTGGTSRFGHSGFNPSGIRVGGKSRYRRAVKVWERREFRDLDDERSLGTRNFKVALRRLRRMAREGRDEEFDVRATIDATARAGGGFEPRYAPTRKNRMRVILLLDVGGSMDPHIQICEELFSAARSELEHLEAFYFHNCPYESVWRQNMRLSRDVVDTEDLMRRFDSRHRLVVVGDAAMSPYELHEVGGSIEHWNSIRGKEWIQRLFAHFRRAVWLNPIADAEWDYTHTTRAIRDLIDNRMFELNLRGLRNALKELMTGHMSEAG